MHSLTQGTQFVGIDVSARRLDVYLHPNDDSFTVTHDRTGKWKLVSRLSAFESSLIVLEPTGGFERDAADLLAETGFDVAIVNARQVRDYAKATRCLAKTDRLDAEVIAHFAEPLRPQKTRRTGRIHRHGRGRRPTPPGQRRSTSMRSWWDGTPHLRNRERHPKSDCHGPQEACRCT